MHPLGGNVDDQAMTALRVILAEDDVLLREGLASLLLRSGLEVVGQAGDASQLVTMVRDQIPDRVRLDLGHLADGIADDVEGELLVPGGPMRTQQAVEELRDGHRAGSLWPCASRQTC